MPFGHSDQLQVGDVVLAIGNPLGLSQTVTHGIVSATGRGQLGLATFENFIQTDAAINPGNSGGALINTRGELVGINTAIVAKTAGVEGIGFAIPVNMVRGRHARPDRPRQGRPRLDRHRAGGFLATSRPPASAWRVAAWWSWTVPGQPGAGGGPAPPATSSPASTAHSVKSSQDLLAHIASTPPGATIRVVGRARPRDVPGDHHGATTPAKPLRRSTR